MGAPRIALVADDEAAIRTLVTRILSKKGFHVLEAVDGVEAVALFRVHLDEISVVIFDVRMPNLAGPDALAQILALRPAVPAVLMSGFVSDHDLTALLACGVRFVSKPLHLDVLAKVVSEIVPSS